MIINSVFVRTMLMNNIRGSLSGHCQSSDLTMKVVCYWYKRNMHSLLKRYLNNRTQFVSFNNVSTLSFYLSLYHCIPFIFHFYYLYNSLLIYNTIFYGRKVRSHLFQVIGYLPIIPEQ